MRGGVLVSDVTSRSVLLSARSTRPARLRVRYGTDPQLSNAAQAESDPAVPPAYTARVILRKLEPGRLYYYHAWFSGAWAEGYDVSTRTRRAGGTFRTRPAAVVAGPAYEGFHDGAECTTIYGWARDRNNPGVPLRVDIYDGDRLLGGVEANQFRKDLLEVGNGDGRLGFSFTPPPYLKDGRRHSIRVTFSGTGILLRRSPRLLVCPPR